MTDDQLEDCDTAIRKLADDLDDVLRAADGRDALTKTEVSKLQQIDGLKPKEGDSIDRLVFRLHRYYKRLKYAAKKPRIATRLPDGKTKTEARAKTYQLTGRLEATADMLHSLLSRRGLREPVAAVLDTGFVLADSGNPAIRYARSTSDKMPYGVVDWESKHFFDNEDGWIDYSFGGRFGLTPSLALVQRQEETAIRTLYQPSFHWHFFGRANLDLKETGGEISLVGRFGQNQLTSETEAVGTQENPISTKLLENGPGRSALFYEGGLEYKLFDNPLANVHEDKTYLAPVVAIGAGIRRDGRFRRMGPLKDFHHPERRWYFRATVNLNKVIDRRPEDGKPKSYALGFSVEYDSPWNRTDPAVTVPSGTKIILTANFDVLSTLSRGVKK
ncbi:MAG: hypothetical protein R2729_20760 [Bryobacteraceae bacterium]